MADKKKRHILLREKYDEKLTRVSKSEGVSRGTIVERGLDKIKEVKDD